jgi:hypothetical protein
MDRAAFVCKWGAKALLARYSVLWLGTWATCEQRDEGANVAVVVSPMRDTYQLKLGTSTEGITIVYDSRYADCCALVRA